MRAAPKYTPIEARIQELMDRIAALPEEKKYQVYASMTLYLDKLDATISKADNIISDEGADQDVPGRSRKSRN